MGYTFIVDLIVDISNATRLNIIRSTEFLLNVLVAAFLIYNRCSYPRLHNVL